MIAILAACNVDDEGNIVDDSQHSENVENANDLKIKP